MITTLFFAQLIGFQLWYLTSKQVKHASDQGYHTYILANKQPFRSIGLALIVLAMVLFVVKLGLMTGLCAALVGLMGVGCLVVLIQPFQYINIKSLLALYVLFFFLELFI